MTVRLVSLTGAETVAHPDFGQASVGADGVFELPDEFGHALAKQAGSWKTETEYLTDRALAELVELADPKKAAEVIADLRREVALLRVEVDALRKKAAPAKAAAKKAAPAKAAE